MRSRDSFGSRRGYGLWRARHCDVALSYGQRDTRHGTLPLANRRCHPSRPAWCWSPVAKGTRHGLSQSAMRPSGAAALRRDARQPAWSERAHLKTPSLKREWGLLHLLRASQLAEAFQCTCRGASCASPLLRHTSAVDTLDVGADLRTFQLKLGHASIVTTQRYLNMASDRLSERQRAFSPIDHRAAKKSASAICASTALAQRQRAQVTSW